MTVPTTSTPDYFRQAAHTGQDAMDTVIRAWGQAWQRFMGDRGRYPGRVANPDDLIDTWFDITSELLAVQRECTKALLALSQPGLAAATCATPQATTATYTSSSRPAGRWG